MKKGFRKFLSSHSAFIKDVAICTSLVGGTASIIFGISAGTFAIHYINLKNAEKRLAGYKNPNSNYSSEKINSEWNMRETNTIEGVDAPTIQKWATPSQEEDPKINHWMNDEAKRQFYALHKPLESQTWTATWDKFYDMGMDTPEGDPLDSKYFKPRYDFSTSIIDGSNHTVMDRSFNQSLYSGLVDFNKNMVVDKVDAPSDDYRKNVASSFKPSQDNTAAFVELYKSVMTRNNLVALAGFNHATPLNELMIHESGGAGGKLKGTVSNPNPELNKQINQTAFILVDSNCPNNQSVASVFFRPDQGGFLTSIATAQYFYNNLRLYHNHYQNLSVGFIGGVPIPTVVDYMGGYQRGVEFFNEFILHNIVEIGGEKYFNSPTDESVHLESFKNLVSFSKYKDDIEALPPGGEGWSEFQEQYFLKIINEYSIKIIKLGNVETHFTGSFAAGDAVGISKQLLNRGASAIICVAGPQSQDVTQEIANQESKCVVVGVDTAMEDSDYQRFHKGYGPKTRENPDESDPYFDQTEGEDHSKPSSANGVIKFSGVKDIRTVTQKITRLAATGMNWDISADDTNKSPDPQRAICGPGFQTCGNILNGLVGISWDGFVPLIQAFRHVIFENNITFEDAWKSAVDTYKDDSSETWNSLPETYRTGIYTLENLLSFRKTNPETGEKTPYYECYNNTLQILGRLLNSNTAQLKFTRDMSLWYDEHGNIGIMKEPEVQANIKEWLDVNMYLYT